MSLVRPRFEQGVVVDVRIISTGEIVHLCDESDDAAQSSLAGLNSNSGNNRTCFAFRIPSSELLGCYYFVPPGRTATALAGYAHRT